MLGAGPAVLASPPTPASAAFSSEFIAFISEAEHGNQEDQRW